MQMQRVEIINRPISLPGYWQYEHLLKLKWFRSYNLLFKIKCEALSEEDFDPSAFLWSIWTDSTFQTLLSSLPASYSLPCEHLPHSSDSPEHQTLAACTPARWLGGSRRMKNLWFIRNRSPAIWAERAWKSVGEHVSAGTSSKQKGITGIFSWNHLELRGRILVVISMFKLEWDTQSDRPSAHLLHGSLNMRVNVVLLVVVGQHVSLWTG